LAIGLSWGSFAGSITDSDGDGVPDIYDNCVNSPNGPLGSGGTSCTTQEDADLDGYGNPCDFDTNNDGATGSDDLSDQLDESGVTGTNPVYDFNCDGASGSDDLSSMLDNSNATTTPGPGLDCANMTGTPCIAD
jgi:hypothetical protein